MAYLLLRRQYAAEPAKLRELYELVEDTEALAELDRTMMGQTRIVETTR